MKTLNNYVNEALIKKDTKISHYIYHPKDFDELRSLLRSLLSKRGKNADLNDIDVSQITTFYDDRNDIGLFEDLEPYNIDISKWNVSNVTDMTNTFFGCFDFNGNLSNWNVKKVKSMNHMFFLCQLFTGESLENWKTFDLENIDYMFYGCKKFNCNLSKWNVNKLTTSNYAFYDCRSLKNIPNW